MLKEGLVIFAGDDPKELEHTKREFGLIDAVAVPIERGEQIWVQLPTKHLTLFELGPARRGRDQGSAGLRARHKRMSTHG